LSLTKQDITTLLALCKKGNQLAQLEVYNRYQKAMFNTALRIVKNTAEAEDVMQESFITAFAKLDTFKGTATFGSWLKRIVVNNSIMQYRKSLRFVELKAEDIKEWDDDTEVNGLSEEDLSFIKAKEIISCMDGLHENYQRILSLHYIEGFDYEELCEILGISYANCRTLISRAKESLRKKLVTPA
jgi:RNA polymerase sigma factor (sigma-70 family)